MVGVPPTPDTAQDDAWSRTLLKHGWFGTVSRLARADMGESFLERDTRAARWGLRALARWLATREARTLALLAGMPGLPKLVDWDGRCLRRSWLEGAPLASARALDRDYFREALRLLRRMHGAGVANTDLAHADNWLVTADGRPALIGFRRARRVRYRGRRFRALACADLRDLLEHKRAHCGNALTARERALLARQGSWVERLWLWVVRPAGRVRAR